jgi:hypothetical protein
MEVAAPLAVHAGESNPAILQMPATIVPARETVHRAAG